MLMLMVMMAPVCDSTQNVKRYRYWYFFSGTKYFWYRYRYFFRYYFFWYQFRYHQKKWKITVPTFFRYHEKLQIPGASTYIRHIYQFIHESYGWLAIVETKAIHTCDYFATEDGFFLMVTLSIFTKIFSNQTTQPPTRGEPHTPQMLITFIERMNFFFEMTPSGFAALNSFSASRTSTWFEFLFWQSFHIDNF